MLGVQPDRIDHQVQFIGAVDLARHAIGLAWRDAKGFCEVVQAIDALGVAILHEKHRTGAVFRPREKEQTIGAEVEHGGKVEGAGKTPAPFVAPLRGYPPDSSARNIVTERRMIRASYSTLGDWPLLALRKLSPPSRKISEFSTNRSAMAVAIVVLCRMLPHSEKAVLLVIMVPRF